MMGIRFTCQYIIKTPALHKIRNFQSGRFHKSRRNIYQFYQSITQESLFKDGRTGNNQGHMDKTFIEIGTFPVQAVISAHFPVITHENNDRVFTQAGLIEIRKQSSKLIINQFNFRVVISETLPFFLLRKRSYGLRLSILPPLDHILLLMGRLALHLSVFPERQRHLFNVQPVFIFLRRI